MEKGNKKIIRAWTFYDWANSVYPLVITTAIFPKYYENVTRSTLPDGTETDIVKFFGFEFVNTALVSYVFSFSFLVVSILIPLLSGVADYTGKKRYFLRIFCTIGSISCACLFFFDPAHLELSLIPLFTASIGFWGSLVFYNAYLPEIAERKDHDRVSAAGYTMGYVGSVLLMVLCLVWIVVLGQPAEYCFLAVGAWWFGFAHWTLSKIPENPYNNKPVPGEKIFKAGFREMRKVWKQVGRLKRLKRYQVAFFVFSMGVQTVMLMAAFYGEKEIDWPVVDGVKDDSGLIISIVLIQLLAGPGAYFMSWLAGKIGNVPVLRIVVLMWVGVCGMAYVIHSPVEFYILAIVVGFVMGGIQSLARSTYSKFIPDTKDHASYFTFYDVLEKLGIVIGVLIYGVLEDVTGSMRYSAIALSGFFVIGFILLTFVPRNEVSHSDLAQDA